MTEAPSPGRAGAGLLARAEVRRFRSRRFIQVLLALGLAGYLLAVGVAVTTEFGRTTPERLAAAQAQIDRQLVEQNGYREQCLAQPPTNLPPGVTTEFACGPPTTAENFGGIENFLDKRPFILAPQLPAGGIAVTVATAALAFLIGATYVGAEWSSRSMVALLFWEPRRIRVMQIKLAVLAGAAAILGLAAQALWWGTAAVLARTVGETGTLPPGFYADLLGQQGRSVLLVVFAALLGFGLSNLIRNTGAALGVGFLYFAIVENAVRNFHPAWQVWLLPENSTALLQTGGYRYYLPDDVMSGPGYMSAPAERVLTNLHGGLVLGGATLALVALGVVLFKRRDLA